jgi:hypothetical protein
MKNIFKISPSGGIYYDNPNTSAEPNKLRACLGIFVNSGEEFKIP